MDNPYEPPKSNVDAINRSNYLNNFSRFSAWWVLLLSVVTLGIYNVYWLYTRSRIINQIHHRKIPEFLIWAALIFYVLNTGLSFLPDEMVASLIIVVLLSAVGSIFFFVWWLFGVRNRLQELAEENGSPENRIGPILTFFFQVIYLQYKINEQIDRGSDLATSEQAAAEAS
ncbi:MAG: DUF4234 domain-containing protein [Candidatus Thiodiazotropha sp. (ex Monitilora ramsayi)]|nr:DUF4234 domain-containing protein [Candidatus Thiodiazotropha sp. (ex Monitilora ramsayi)]